MDAFEYDAFPVRVVFGLGARGRVADEVAALDASRVFLVASTSATAAADEVAEAFGDRLAARWSEVAEHVPIPLAASARAAARASNVDVIVCIGGGSTIGLAKAVALEVDVPIVAVPTTYAGSEMTAMYGLTGEHKETGHDPRVRPKVVVYDPELTLGLPVPISTSSACNALAHCVEGCYGPGANPITTLAALEGIRVLAHAMPLLVPAPKDPAVRSDLLYGAYLAGSVLATVGVGVHHRTCHVLGGSYGLAHASCNAVILPHAIAYNAPVIPGVLARVGAALSPEPVAREDVAGFTFDLIAGLGLPTSLEALGLPEPMLDAAAHRIVSETPSNPRRMDFATVRAMLDDAWHGRRP